MTGFISIAVNSAQAAMADADRLITSAQQQASSTLSVAATKIDYSPINIVFDEPSAPVAFDSSFVEPTFGETAELRDIIVPEVLVLPDAPEALDMGSLFQASVPSFNISDAGLEAPALATPTLPSAPDVNLPTHVPASSNLVAPSITAPTFDAAFDAADPGALGDQDIVGQSRVLAPEIQARVEAFADSQLADWCPQYGAAMATLETKISQALNGNTAIDDAIELQIWNRARSRAMDERYGIERQATDTLSRRGFAIPPGALQAALDQAHAAYTKAVAMAASETAIERAKIELNHLQFTMNLSATMRQAMVQAIVQTHANAIQIVGASVDIAKSAAEIAVSVHNANVEIYRAKLDVYRVKADVYRVRLEAAFADLEIFKAQVEAERLKADLDRNAIEVYTAKIAAEEAKVRMYVARLEGVRQIAELERNKVALFEAKVRAYAAKVQGKEAEFGAYRAAIEGDKVKAEIHRTRVDTYRGQIDALRAINESNKVNADITSDYNRSVIELFDANVKKYAAQLDASGKVYESKRDAHMAAIELYKADLMRSLEKANTALRANEQNMALAIRRADITAETNIATARLKESANETAAQMAMHGASAYGSMASAALGVIGYNESWSGSF